MVGTILSLTIEAFCFYYGYGFYKSSLDLISADSGLSLLVALITTAPVLAVIMIITSVITVNLLVKSIIKIKTHWWLLIVQLSSVVAHVYVISNFLSVLQK